MEKNQNKIEAHLKKIEFHAKMLQKLGVGLNTILEKIDLTPSVMPYEQVAASTNLFLQPTIWRYLLFAVWRFKIIEDKSSDTHTTISYKIGAYKNGYMKSEEKEERENLIALFFEPLGFTFVRNVPTFNNAMYYEEYIATLPIPMDDMIAVISLLCTKKADENCESNREEAKKILARFF